MKAYQQFIEEEGIQVEEAERIQVEEAEGIQVVQKLQIRTQILNMIRFYNKKKEILVSYSSNKLLSASY